MNATITERFICTQFRVPVAEFLEFRATLDLADLAKHRAKMESTWCAPGAPDTTREFCDTYRLEFDELENAIAVVMARHAAMCAAMEERGKLGDA